MSSAALAYLGLLKAAVTTLTGGDKPLAGWTVMDTVPGEKDPVSITKHVLMDLVEEGEAVLSDGSGYGALYVVLVAVDLGTSYSAARTLVADAVDSIRERLRDPTSKCRPNRFHVAYPPASTLYASPVFMATVEIERKLV